MFCPVCKNEYREGFTMCSDCKIPLEENLATISVKEDNLDNTNYKLLTSTFNKMDVAMIKSIFGSENIEYYISDEISMNNLATVPAKFFIKTDQFEIAKQLLLNMNIKYTIL